MTSTNDGWASPRPVDTRWRVLADALQALWTLLVATLAVFVGLWVIGISIVDSWGLMLVVVAGIVLLDFVLASPLRWLAARGSVLLALVLGLGAQLLVLTTLFTIASYGRVTVRDTTVVLLVAAAVLSLARWFSGATDSAYVVGAATGRRGRARARAGAAPERRGLLMVQLDGVALPVLRRAIAGGQAPNIARWIGTSHTLTGWWATIPSTTPATMAGILHASDDVVPAFRWWDRRAGRLLAASNAADSSLVESRFGRSEGLLRDGVAISTTYTGGAERTYLVISRATSLRQLGSGASYLSFFMRPLVLPGAIVLTLGEIIKELHQSRLQRVRDVRPRIPRKGVYILLRALTNVLLRRLNLSLIAEEMANGAPIIFVDFVDYDEIAHHAGPERPEAMRAIEGLDGALAAVEDVARSVGTEYDLIIVSDHGQSLGSTFEELAGSTFPDRVSDLMDAGAAGASMLTSAEGGEDWGPINALLASVLGERATHHERVVIRDPESSRDEIPHDEQNELPHVAVTGGGNLGMIWFPRLEARPTLSEVTTHWPRLVPGLLASEGIGLVMATDDDGQPIVLGPAGAYRLGPEPSVTGEDPLAGYPSRTAADLARLHALPDAGDLVVLSTVDELGRIHALEGQVGSHGGIGGPQNEAVLIHPRDWPLEPDLCEVVPELGPEPVLVGAWTLSEQIRRWRESAARPAATHREHPS